ERDDRFIKLGADPLHRRSRTVLFVGGSIQPITLFAIKSRLDFTVEDDLRVGYQRDLGGSLVIESTQLCQPAGSRRILPADAQRQRTGPLIVRSALAEQLRQTQVQYRRLLAQFRTRPCPSLAHRITTHKTAAAAS